MFERQQGTRTAICETPAEFSRRLARLEAQARLAYPDGSAFVRALDEAKAAGATYREALETLLLRASGGVD